MTSLYTNAKGRDVRTSSYSGSADFRKCEKYFEHKRVNGWAEKTESAAFKFGICVEDAIKYWYANEQQAGTLAPEFTRLWLKFKDQNLDYTDSDGDWENLAVVGRKLTALYEIKAPSLGLLKPRFQLEYRKAVFPNTEYSDIERVAYIDMRAEQVENFLTPEEQPRPILVDIKTSGKLFPSEPEGIVALDPQLREYSWMTGIRDVAFLVLVKTSENYKKGDSVFLLQNLTQFKTGDEATVATADEDQITIVRKTDFETYESSAKGLRGNAAKEAIADLCRKGEQTSAEAITKQRIQFLRATISEADIKEVGEIIASEIVDQIEAHKRKLYRKTGAGIRFPNNTCLLCPMLGLCLGNDRLRDEKLIQIGATQKDLLADLGDE